MDPTKRAGINWELLGLAEPIAEPPISDGPTTGTTPSNQIQVPQLGHSVSTSKSPEVAAKDSSQSDLLVSWRISVTDEDFTETRHEEVAGNLRLINEENRNLGSFGGCSSDAGASNCSFLSIVPVQDMGHSDYIEWESSEMANDCVGTQALHSHHPALRPQDNTNDDADVQTMSDAMFAASITSASEDKGFLPLDALRRIVTPTAVQRLLGHAFPHFKPKVINSWVSSISGKPDEVKTQPRRRKIFAILILMEQVKLIEDFIKHNIDDSFLPLEIKRNSRHKPVIQLQRKDGTVLSCLNHWRTKHINNFVQCQETICTPFFKLPGDDVHYYEITSKTILPFEEYDLVQIGGYGSVRKVRIHHAHYSRDNTSKASHNLWSYNYTCFLIPPQDRAKILRHFAVKQLHLETHEEYAREVELFERLGVGSRGPDPDHLIQLQLTYKYGQSYYLVFPWADGNLREFWSKTTANPDSKAETVWFLSQCLGLVRALRRIHNLRTMSKEDNYVAVSNDPNVLLDNKHWGRHGDIKPENILWFKKYEESRRNFLVISDFGLTRFNTADSRSKVAYDAVRGFSGSYRPPDVDLKRTISQRYDIWSLGCVFLEFVSWFLVGHDRTQKDFTDARIQEDGLHTGSRILLEDKFFNFNPSKDDAPPTADVKTSVTDYTMLVPDAKERWACSRIQPVINELIRKSKRDAAYATSGTYGVSDPLRFPCIAVESPAVCDQPDKICQIVTDTGEQEGKIPSLPGTPDKSGRRDRSLSLSPAAAISSREHKISQTQDRVKRPPVKPVGSSVQSSYFSRSATESASMLASDRKSVSRSARLSSFSTEDSTQSIMSVSEAASSFASTPDTSPFPSQSAEDCFDVLEQNLVLRQKVACQGMSSEETPMQWRKEAIALTDT
ncbi:serine/threonine protein kinase [Colletotrichum simmondsii]|uniref:Serine/threonine protein kinase n=1 Tax=Colletotrichum simmondsii TaxID=703756 RepID=A0A135TQI1_9PEZI|nr:serine/threonine protein kinase [Colletotrichum simmondsii]